MPSYLGEYSGGAKSRKIKMARAIQSFLKQDYKNKELVVVADGCDDTISFLVNNFADEPTVIYWHIDKQPNFSGKVRSAGLQKATGDIICYLDNDDQFKEKDHLSKIVSRLDINTDWVYFNDYVKHFGIDTLPVAERHAVIKKGQIGTSNIAHRHYDNISWDECNGYGHDFTFIKALELNYPNFKKITGPSYLVCHIPGSVDT